MKLRYDGKLKIYNLINNSAQLKFYKTSNILNNIQKEMPMADISKIILNIHKKNIQFSKYNEKYFCYKNYIGC